VQISVTVDSSQLQAWLLLAEKKLAYAAVNGLNATSQSPWTGRLKSLPRCPRHFPPGRVPRT
jgi:hypothetical protein